MGYFYYCFYCFATLLHKNERAYYRANGAFAFTLTFLIFSVSVFAKSKTDTRSEVEIYLAGLIIGCHIFSFLFFNKVRSDDIVNYYDHKIGKWNKIHGLAGILYFMISIILFAYSSYKIKYIN